MREIDNSIEDESRDTTIFVSTCPSIPLLSKHVLPSTCIDDDASTTFAWTSLDEIESICNLIHHKIGNGSGLETKVFKDSYSVKVKEGRPF